jgi:hypothetical protein
VAELDVQALADEIVREMRADDRPERCQRLVVLLASHAGWREARRLLLARAHQARPVAGRAA